MSYVFRWVRSAWGLCAAEGRERACALVCVRSASDVFGGGARQVGRGRWVGGRKRVKHRQGDERLRKRCLLHCEWSARCGTVRKMEKNVWPSTLPVDVLKYCCLKNLSSLGNRRPPAKKLRDIRFGYVQNDVPSCAGSCVNHTRQHAIMLSACTAGQTLFCSSLALVLGT